MQSELQRLREENARLKAASNLAYLQQQQQQQSQRASVLRRGSTSIPRAHQVVPVSVVKVNDDDGEEEDDTGENDDEEEEETPKRGLGFLRSRWGRPLLVILGALIFGVVILLAMPSHSTEGGEKSLKGGFATATPPPPHPVKGAASVAAAGGGAGGAGAAPSSKPARPSASRPPSASNTNAPLAPCSCEKAERKWHWMLHMLDSDKQDAMVMGSENLVEGKAVESGVFGFSNVLSLTDSDPSYPNGRTVILDRPKGRGKRSEFTGEGDELNQATADDLMFLTHAPVAGQNCHKVTTVPYYFYVDTNNDGDAGEWLGESALFLNKERWGQLQARHPDIKLMFKAPAPHKSAILQLLGIPDSAVSYLSPSFPCEAGNRVYVPPFGRNVAPGWSQHWWKETHTRMFLELAREKAGFTAPCPPLDKSPPPQGVVYVTLSSSDKLKKGASKGDEQFESSMKDFVAGGGVKGGGTVVHFPDTLPLKEGEVKAFVAAIASARVVVLHASSSVWMFAGLARGATVIVVDAQQATKVLNTPGHITEQKLVAQYNKIITLGSEGEKLKAIEEATNAITAALENKEKVPPKCTPPPK